MVSSRYFILSKNFMSNTMRFTIHTCLFIIAFSHKIVFPQDTPITWGEIPRADLEMKAYPADTNASALILCDYGESKLSDDLGVNFTRHLRVKIFTKEGYETGTIKVPVESDDEVERISKIRGTTYVISADGSVQKTELRDRDILIEKVNDRYSRYCFTLPALQPGCVFELSYKIHATSYYWHLMKDWIFQTKNPVRWSEYRITHPKCIGFTMVTRGYEPFIAKEAQSVNQTFLSDEALSFLGANRVECWLHQYIVQNAPAIRDEPYMKTPDDYVNKLEVQISGLSPWIGSASGVFNSWDKFVDYLRDDPSFCRVIGNTRKIRNLTESLITGLSSPEDKMIAIYNWVTKSIVCTHNGIWAHNDLDEVLDDKKGNCSDITMLLLSMLKLAGIDGYPVILSTRDNGELQETYPIATQFNYVLAKVIIGSKSYFLDATDPLKPWDMIPPKVLGVRALVVKPNPHEWVTLSSSNDFSYTSLAKMKINDDGSIQGTFEDMYRDYAALEKRKGLKEKKEIEIVKEAFSTETNGFSVDSISIDGKDSVSRPVRLKALVSSSTYTQVNGDYIYINPRCINRLKENPFKSKNRKFPIDFPYRSNVIDVVNIELPDSFEVKEKISNHNISMGGNLATYTVSSQVEGKQIQISSKFSIRETQIKPLLYEELKSFYAKIVDAESEQIVLSRIHPPVVMAPEVKTTVTAPAKEAASERKNQDAMQGQKRKGKK